MLASAEVQALALVLASQLWFWASEDPGDAEKPPAVILYLVSSHPNGLDAHALADVVGVYTRDLQVTVKTIPDDVAAPTPAAIERVTASLRALRARLAFWCVPSEDGRTIRLHSVDARGIDRKDVVNVAGLQGPDLDRAVALKLRAILTPEGADSADSGGAHDSVHRASPSVPPPSPRVEARLGAPEVVPATSAPPRPSSTLRLAAVFEYCVSTNPVSGAPRQALALAAIGDLGQVVELVTSVEVPLPAEQTTPTGTVSLFDVPLRVGGRLTYRATHLVTGVGLFGALHLLSASATPSGGTKTDALTAAGGAGLEALVRGPTPWRFSWEIRGWAEGLVPRTWFIVEGRPAFETGRFTVGLGLGVAFPTQ